MVPSRPPTVQFIVSANCAEARRSHSLADTAAKQQMCIKECEETAYWLRLLVKGNILSATSFDPLIRLSAI